MFSFSGVRSRMARRTGPDHDWDLKLKFLGLADHRSRCSGALASKHVDSSPVLAEARTTPSGVPLRTSSGTVKKYWACSKTGDVTEPPTTLTLTRAFTGAVRPPPSSADISMEITVLALP